jgi:riboflavin synthase
VFTGLIEEIGEIAGVRETTTGRRLRVRAERVLDGLVEGDSVSISGVCQTVVALPEPGCFVVHAVPETLRRTTLAGLKQGSPVNLERAARVGDRLGGHIVNGHIDATARILEARRSGGETAYRIELPAGIARYVVEKGSIAVDGVSLTVGEVDSGSFRVYIIPETLERTLFGRYRAGDRVNLEADVLAKYVERVLGPHQGSAALARLEAWSEEGEHGAEQ